MATLDNPYGVALFSACFWVWTYKTGGWKYFVKYCERHGLPWPVARYEDNASDKDLDDLEEAIQHMVESGYAIVPQGTGVDLLVPNASGSTLPQEKLINMCNREMSKAINGQAMISELQDTGARAASETAKERQDSINKSDMSIAAAGFTQIFRLITDFNFGEDVAAPYFEFYDQKEAGKDRAEVYDMAANTNARPSRKAYLEELNIPEAVDDEDVLQPISKQPDEKAVPVQFARAGGGDIISLGSNIVDMASAAADDILAANVIEPIARMLEQAEKDGKTLAEAKEELAGILGNVDMTALLDITNKALTLSTMQGYTDAER
jgi:phage gp29-like protein